MNHEQYTNADENCIFCKIVKGDLPAIKIFEDDFTLAFLNNSPTNPGHALVIAKDHFENIYTTPTELYCRVQMTVQKIALAVRNSVDADGINIIINNEAAAGQVIFHSHVHVIPRHNDDGLVHWRHAPYKDEQEAIVIKEKIVQELKESQA